MEGSPRLERQVQKLTIQMHHQCPQLTAAGYFTLGRNMILKVGEGVSKFLRWKKACAEDLLSSLLQTIGVAVVFTFFMVKFKHLMDQNDPVMNAAAEEGGSDESSA